MYKERPFVSYLVFEYPKVHQQGTGDAKTKMRYVETPQLSVSNVFYCQLE